MEIYMKKPLTVDGEIVVFTERQTKFDQVEIHQRHLCEILAARKELALSI